MTKMIMLSTFTAAVAAAAGAPQGGAGYTFALPGGQAYVIYPGNLYLPAQNSGYTVTYQKSRRSLSVGGSKRPGGYAFTLPANQKIVINPGNLQMPGNAEGYSIIYANEKKEALPKLDLKELPSMTYEEYYDPVKGVFEG